MVRIFIKIKVEEHELNQSLTAANASAHAHFDLSRNASLRTLETTARSITVAGDSASSFLKSVLSTIASPLPTDVVIVYREGELGFHIWRSERPITVEYAPWLRSSIAHHPGRFKVLREMCGTREFRLVLCADVIDSVAKGALQTLKHLVDVERENGRLDCLSCEPLIITEVRAPRSRLRDDRTGYTKERPILSSAL